MAAIGGGGLVEAPWRDSLQGERGGLFIAVWWHVEAQPMMSLSPIGLSLMNFLRSIDLYC